MTQRKWDTTDGWSVLTGWDRPLQHYFVSISRECPDCDGQGFGQFEGLEETECLQCQGRGEEFLFDNLSDHGGFTDRMGGMTLESVEKVLDDKLTSWPHGVIGILRRDQELNLGNDIVTFAQQGEQKQKS